MARHGDYQVQELQAQVWQATAAAQRALESYELPVRTLAVRQLAIETEIRVVATGLLDSQAAARKPAAQAGADMTIEQVAERSKVSKDCVKRWLGRGVLKKTKVGGRTVVTEADYQDFRERSTEKNRTDAAA